MASFLDEREEEINEGEELANFEEPEEETPEVAEEPEVEEPVEDELPDKYRGKTTAEIARMHAEAEKLIGRQSSEVGELRKIIDDFVQTQLASNKQASPQETVEDDLDFFEDPKLAVTKTAEKLLKEHPALKEVEELNQNLRQQQALSKMKSAHPDFEAILGDEKFQSWVAGSKVRQELYNRADKRFDFDAADELFSNWKERQNIVAETAEVHKKDRKRQVKAASTGSANGTGEVSRKIYRRQDIIDLMKNDPDRYLALSDEITQAYLEKRVR